MKLLQKAPYFCAIFFGIFIANAIVPNQPIHVESSDSLVMEKSEIVWE
ncbi:hypothetical protein [Alteromonas mediterranea]|nr:hypothetical protein [Alteromonas mediterranea]|tara:strand:- start:856 stop:999 length:144 start_codon:yes stop_codon:yes gene_type:complete